MNGRPLKKAHLRECGRPRPPCRVGREPAGPTMAVCGGLDMAPALPPAERTPDVRLSGAASDLGLFEQPGCAYNGSTSGAVR
jgi:hypothetical protein